MARAFNWHGPIGSEVGSWLQTLPDGAESEAVLRALGHERRLVNDLLAALRSIAIGTADGAVKLFAESMIARAEGVPLGVESAMGSPVVGAEVRAAHELRKGRVDGPMGLPLSRVRTDGK